MSPMMQIQLSLENLDNILYCLFPSGTEVRQDNNIYQVAEMFSFSCEVEHVLRWLVWRKIGFLIITNLLEDMS